MELVRCAIIGACGVCVSACPATVGGARADAGDATVTDVVDVTDVPDAPSDITTDVPLRDALVDMTDAPDAPQGFRLRSPLSTARVTTHRPTVRWINAGPMSTPPPFTVEFCRDRACASVIERVVAEVPMAQPAHALPSGVVFWRVTHVEKNLPVVATATWQFEVPHVDAATDTSWSGSQDFDGDGLADVAVTLSTSSTATAQSVYVFSGARGGASTPPRVITDARATPDAGNHCFFAGDLDGDGYGDLVLSARANTATGYYFPGGPGGISPRPASQLRLRSPYVVTGAHSGQTAGTVAPIGDYDGDGYGDLVVVAPIASSGAVIVWVARGSPAGPISDDPGAGFAWLSYANPREMMRPSPADGRAAGSAGDVDGDGLPDLWTFAEWGTAAFETPVAVLRAVSCDPAAAPLADLTYPSPIAAAQGIAAAGVGDVDGDGRSDVGWVVGCLSPVLTTRAWRSDRTFRDRLIPGTTFPAGSGCGARSLVGNHDLDGDGFDDVVTVLGFDAAAVRLGGSSGLGAPIALPVQPLRGNVGARVESVGDIDGDGYGDITLRSGNGPVTVFYGGAAWSGARRATLAVP